MVRTVLANNLSATIFRKDLIEAKDLKQIFRKIRNLLAGNFVGTTRDERLAEQLIFLLFCKINDELIESPNEPVIFQLNYPGSSTTLQRITQLFNQLKNQHKSLFDAEDRLYVDETTLTSIIANIEKFSITKASRDVIGDAFEIFLGPSLRGNKGQFFTPKNIVQTMIQILDPTQDEQFIDPACGTGGFLIVGLAHQLKKTEERNNKISNFFFGIDKDQFLAKISRLYLAILGLKGNVIFCENSLNSSQEWSSETSEAISLNSFDVVCTNPPFGAKIPIKSKEILQNYHLGRKWKKKSNGSWFETNDLLEKQPPQVLFIERCLEFLKPGGRMGIVLPDGIFGNPSDRYILHYLRQQVEILALISCSHLAFLPHTHTKTSLLFIRKVKPQKDYSFFMAIAENVGHDKNGKPLYLIDKKGDYILDSSGKKIVNDDFPKIIQNYKKFTDGRLQDHSHLGFIFRNSEIDNQILIPEYYNPEIMQRLDKLEKAGNYRLVRIGDLKNEGIIQITRGHEIGSKFYGTGDIPFVRTSDLINWEINIDPKKQVAGEIYEQYKDKQDIRAGDILLVSDGTFLIGKTAMITERDTQIIIQSHLKKIRVIKKELLDEFLLLWSLNTDIVQDQIKAKTFIQSTISTLGNRLMDLLLPIPREMETKNAISQEIKEIIQEKMALKDRIRTTLKILEI
ncbi:MAG: N-6 DNA methylase [Candidatus Heimdallarchaeota archaeon]|nr:MAG: N-6 DNA methylase [Candidatus Heimdallarchaeota archaeon]